MPVALRVGMEGCFGMGALGVRLVDLLLVSLLGKSEQDFVCSNHISFFVYNRLAV